MPKDRKTRESKIPPLFAVVDHWKLVDAKGAVVERITTEYLSEDDAIDSEDDAMRIAIARLGYRLEADDRRNDEEAEMRAERPRRGRRDYAAHRKSWRERPR